MYDPKSSIRGKYFMNYRLIVIENSLKDKNIFNKYKTLSKTWFEKSTPHESFMYKIRVPEKDIHAVTEFLKNNILYPYYTHLYHEDPKNDTLIVVFKGKIFNMCKSNFVDAINYGISHGVTKEQMDIKPRDIQEERW
jgi:carbonic anhydrase